MGTIQPIEGLAQGQLSGGDEGKTSPVFSRSQTQINPGPRTFGSQGRLSTLKATTTQQGHPYPHPVGPSPEDTNGETKQSDSLSPVTGCRTVKYKPVKLGGANTIEWILVIMWHRAYNWQDICEVVFLTPIKLKCVASVDQSREAEWFAKRTVNLRYISTVV